MKMQGPAGVCSPISHAGVEIHLDDDNCVEVNDSIAAVLSSHGFAPYVEPAPASRVRARPVSAPVSESKEGEQTKE